MGYAVGLIFTVVSVCLFWQQDVGAQATYECNEPRPVVYDPGTPSQLEYVPGETCNQVIVTAIGGVSGWQFDFVEIYNHSGKVVDLSGWHMSLSYESGIVADVDLPSGGLMDKSYLALARPGVVAGAEVLTDIGPELPLRVELIDDNGDTVFRMDQPDTEDTGQFAKPTSSTTWIQRKSTGLDSMISDWTSKTASTLEIRTSSLYDIVRQSPRIQIVEIYPQAMSCAPTDESVLCGDYVKLFNPTSDVIDLSSYRLRTDSGTSESGNAFHWSGIEMAPGSYLTVYLRDDGGRMSITNTGGYVWIEDFMGVEPYPETVVGYPDASSTTKSGWAWAYDDITGQWGWTDHPNPDGYNIFPEPEPVVLVAQSALAPCDDGYERNPETNRCRKIVTAESSLAPCQPGYERNPETNRCRKVVTADDVLTPCDEGYERNPETNRCRKIAGATTGSVVPCRAGYERNPETNRCRKVVATDTPLLPDQEESGYASGLLLGLVATSAAGYGMFEWRRELWHLIRRLSPPWGKG